MDGFDDPKFESQELKSNQPILSGRELPSSGKVSNESIPKNPEKLLLKIPETEISEANVVLTMLDGEMIYGSWDMKVLEKTAL